MAKKIIVGLTGQIACGKGVIKKYLIEKYGFSDYRFSTILRDVLTRLHLDNNRENLQHLSTALRQEFGEDLLAHAIFQDIQKGNHDLVVIDGIRRLTDIKHLRELPEFKLIRIMANKKLRYDRVVSRNENEGDDKKTFEQFLADQEQEAESQIPAVMATAEFEIVNEGSLPNLEKEVDKIIEIIKK